MCPNDEGGLMKKNEHPFTARAGDTFTRIITWTDENDTPINLTDAIIEWSLKRGNQTHQWINESQALVTNAENGEITLHLTYEETRQLRNESRLWWYELTVGFPATRTTILEGTLTIDRELVE